MAVFTTVSNQNASDLLVQYNLGQLVQLTGISAGIENTNYFLDTTKGSYVLTVFEVLTHAQLPFYVELMHWLASRDLPVPMPQTRADGARLSTMFGKPVIIVSKLSGHWIKEPTALHCALAAQTMARAHLAAEKFTIQQPNLRGLSWWQTTAPTVMAFIDEGQRRLLQGALDEQVRLHATGALRDLPYGPAHCDYFRDNVLFDQHDGQPVMGGVIDFYFAGCDYWLFDLAVAVNDWCVDPASGELDPARVCAWLNAYQGVRPLTAQEREQWPAMLRAAALRFWISRLYDFYKPRAAQTLTPHDPTHFERILRLRSTETFHWFKDV
jgi:homoserine kinase type II